MGKSSFKKSQAALEFLTTYAWAFLIIIITIAAISYFGVLRPERVLPNRCIFSPELQCIDHQVTGGAANELRIKLKNNAGGQITITALSASSDTATPYSCTNPSLPLTLSGGNITDLVFTNCNPAAAGFGVGDKAKISIKVSYYDQKSSAAYSRDVYGEIYSVVV